MVTHLNSFRAAFDADVLSLQPLFYLAIRGAARIKFWRGHEVVRAPISAQEGANFGSGGRYQCLARMAKCTLVFALTWSRDLNPPKLRFYFRYSRRKLPFYFTYFRRKRGAAVLQANKNGLRMSALLVYISTPWSGHCTVMRAPTDLEDAVR